MAIKRTKGHREFLHKTGIRNFTMRITLLLDMNRQGFEPFYYLTKIVIGQKRV